MCNDPPTPYPSSPRPPLETNILILDTKVVQEVWKRVWGRGVDAHETPIPLTATDDSWEIVEDAKLVTDFGLEAAWRTIGGINTNVAGITNDLSIGRLGV